MAGAVNTAMRHLPESQQPPALDLDDEMLQRPVALLHALAGGNVERPLVLRAGEALAVEREVRDVGHLVRAAAVVHTVVAALTVDEQAAAVAVAVGDFAFGVVVVA